MFPPDGGPSVQRVAKFAKYLAKFGHTLIILTTPATNNYKDYSLLKDLPEEILIYRTTDIGRYIPGDIKKKLLSFLFFPDKARLWHFTAVKKGIKLAKKYKVDIIFASSPPFSVQQIAQSISQDLKIPLISDFRDEWSFYPDFHKWKKKKEHRILEKNILDYVSHVTTITEEAKTHFETITKTPVSVLTNGYDLEDFTNISEKTETKNEIVLSYCGRLNNTHSPRVFFKLLNEHIAKDNNFKNKFSIKIIGNKDNDKWVNSYPYLKPCVKIYDYLPHDQCLLEMANSDIFLLFATQMFTTQFLPAKMFEYFYFKKPVLAVISRKGELFDVLSTYNACFVFLENDIQHNAIEFERLIKYFSREIELPQANQTTIDTYNRRNITAKLDKLIREILK